MNIKINSFNSVLFKSQGNYKECSTKDFTEVLSRANNIDVEFTLDNGKIVCVEWNGSKTCVGIMNPITHTRCTLTATVKGTTTEYTQFPITKFAPRVKTTVYKCL